MVPKEIAKIAIEPIVPKNKNKQMVPKTNCKDCIARIICGLMILLFFFFKKKKDAELFVRA